MCHSQCIFIYLLNYFSDTKAWSRPLFGVHRELWVDAEFPLRHLPKVPTMVLNVLNKYKIVQFEVTRQTKRRLCEGCVEALPKSDDPCAPHQSSGIGALQTDDIHILHQDVDNFVSDLPSELHQKLASSLGKFDSRAAKACAAQSNKNRNLEHLMDFSCDQYAHDSNRPLSFDFIEGIVCGKPSNNNNPESSYKTGKSYESILALSSPVKIMPMHFRETVLLYSLTRSRLALSLLGGGSPYGSY